MAGSWGKGRGGVGGGAHLHEQPGEPARGEGEDEQHERAHLEGPHQHLRTARPHAAQGGEFSEKGQLPRAGG